MKILKMSIALSVLVALAVTLTGCCCPFDLTSLLSGTEFTAGDFADVPTYPGATQSTGSDTALSAMTAFFSLITSELEWKHYVTSDSDSTVADWYEARVPDYGWREASEEEIGTTETEGGLFFVNDNDPELFLVIMVISGLQEESSDTDILVGRMRLSTNEE